MGADARSSQAVLVVASFNSVFVLSQFYRSAVAVIAPDLSRELGLGPEALGTVGGAFFVAIALAQIPVGILLDRFGPRRTTPSLLSLAIIGSIIFAQAEGRLGLVVGQALIGAGCAGVFMGGLVAVARWYTPDRFAFVSSIMVAVSVCGMLISATPFAWLAEQIGWRAAFLGIAGVTAVFGILLAIVARDAPPGHPYFQREPDSLRAIVGGLFDVLRDRNLPFLLAIAFVAYAAVFSIRGLWGGPYLADVYGLDGVARGNVLLIMSLGTITGILFYGRLDHFLGQRRRLVLSGAGFSVFILLLLALLPKPSLYVVTGLFFVLGVAGAYVVLLLAHGRALFPEHLVGRAVTTVNFANFVGVGVIQVVTGFLIGLFPEVDGASPELAYRVVFGFVAATLLIAAFLYSRVEEPRTS